MIQFDPHANAVMPNIASHGRSVENTGGNKNGFSEAVQAVSKYVSNVDDLQKGSDASVEELLTGENNDLTSVVAAVAKADVSFKVLVGVRNKLIEAYKQTINMPL